MTGPAVPLPLPRLAQPWAASYPAPPTPAHATPPTELKPSPAEAHDESFLPTPAGSPPGEVYPQYHPQQQPYQYYSHQYAYPTHGLPQQPHPNQPPPPYRHAWPYPVLAPPPPPMGVRREDVLMGARREEGRERTGWAPPSGREWEDRERSGWERRELAPRVDKEEVGERRELKRVKSEEEEEDEEEERGTKAKKVKTGSTKVEKRFPCPHEHCGRAFARNFNLQSHIKSHLGVREFFCPECPKQFSRRHDCARHCIAVHHYDKNATMSASTFARRESAEEEES